jgi:hypothetical protein
MFGGLYHELYKIFMLDQSNANELSGDIECLSRMTAIIFAAHSTSAISANNVASQEVFQVIGHTLARYDHTSEPFKQFISYTVSSCGGSRKYGVEHQL